MRKVLFRRGESARRKGELKIPARAGETDDGTRFRNRQKGAHGNGSGSACQSLHRESPFRKSGSCQASWHRVWPYYCALPDQYWIARGIPVLGTVSPSPMKSENEPQGQHYQGMSKPSRALVLCLTDMLFPRDHHWCLSNFLLCGVVALDQES